MWKLALLLAALACLLLVLPVFSKQAGSHKRALLMAAMVLAAAALVIGRFFAAPVRQEMLLTGLRPIEVAGHDDTFASSASCKRCHAEECASWHASYHRTMTQTASPSSVIGDFDNVRTRAYGHELHLRRQDGEFWVTMHDPEQPVRANSPMIDRPIVLTTGSHHMQVYWYATGKDRRLGQLPIVWLKETNSWAPIHSIFLRPTQTKLGKAEGRWNQTCIKCHTTSGRPRVSREMVDTHVAEFGIACESCHGPGAAHVRTHADPAPVAGPAATMVNPAELDHRRAAEVCGQCHGVWMAADEVEAARFLDSGFSFRPGDVLGETRHVFSSIPEQPVSAHVQAVLATDPHFMADRFWSDGMVRVSGREYNGLIRSPCFHRGAMSCVSCHDLHARSGQPIRDWADDQLAAGMESNSACTQCHESYLDPVALTRHTHHAAESTGSLCYNCHMPHTTYGLLKAIRSHQISSPSVQESVEVGRPNACNQCHIDKSLSWTATSLANWYGISEPAELSTDEQAYSATLLWALTGDAGQRVLAAWSLGWSPALDASDSGWAAPILATLLDDPYHAVRYVAHRSLKSHPGLDQLAFNFIGDDQDRAACIAAVMEQWRGQRGTRKPDASLLSDSRGDLMLDELQRLRQKRNDRVVVLAE